MDKKVNFSSTLTDTLLPAVIIREHIQKILQADNIETYIADIEKFEDLMSTEIDEDYEKEEEKIIKKVKAFTIDTPMGMNRDSSNEFNRYESGKRKQYEKKLIFRSLVKLAKRKGIWLVDEEDAVISHDKKKSNFYGQKIIGRILETMHGNEKNWDCAVSGKRGDGKSFVAMELALTLDPTFDISRVVFNLDDFLELVETLPPHHFVVADEIGEWFGARNFMKEENKDLADLLQIFRVCQLGVIYTVPAMYQVDKNLRTMGDVFIKALRVHRDKNLGETKYFDVETDSIRGKKPYTKHPIIRGPDGYKKKITKVFFGRIPPSLEQQYRKKKDEFTKRIIAEKREQSQRRKDKKEGNDKPEPNVKCEKCNYVWFTAAIKPRCYKCGSLNVVAV